MDYGSYQAAPPPSSHGRSHHHGATHLPSGYAAGPPTTGPVAPSVSTSHIPPPQLHPHHPAYSQGSPILPSQAHTMQHPTGSGPTGHALHSQLAYPPQYAVSTPSLHPHHGMSPTQAAAMATAAASGQAYYSLHNDQLPPNLTQDPRASPRMGVLPVKKERNPRSSPPVPGQRNGPVLPPQAASGGRRMSQQLASPALPDAAPVMSHAAAAPTRTAGPPSMSQLPSALPQPQAVSQPPPPPPPPQSVVQAPPPLQQPTQHHQSSPEVSTAAEESPLYVNAKQFHRILKRRVARQRLEEALRLTSKGRKPYLHESRHNHAMNRPRGPGGRFLTAEEVAEMNRNKREENGNGATDKENTRNSAQAAASRDAGSTGKRKARDMSEQDDTPTKRAKMANAVGGGHNGSAPGISIIDNRRRSTSADESEDLDDEYDDEEGDGDS